MSLLPLTLDDCLIPTWPVPRNVRALVTTRAGGVSAPPYGQWRDGRPQPGGLNFNLRSGDERRCVMENRARIAALTGVRMAWLAHAHGTTVVHADEVIEQQAQVQRISALQADASVTHQPYIGCIVTAADCLPVLICDSAGRAVGAAHAGWRGLAAGVIENTAAQVSALAGNAECCAFLGPSIGVHRFEVGEEVREIFLAQATLVENAATDAAFRPRAGVLGKYWADLLALARQRLARVGIQRIYGGQWCTASDPARFYSYRRDHITATFAAMIWLTD